LQQAVIELRLDNVRVVSGRVEAVSDVRADVVTSRAFAELADFVSWTVHLLKDGGYWAAMKGVYPQEEIGRLPQDVCVEKVQRLDVPGLDAERHIVILSKR
ncbi:class I SAM-dependent methyltransferase, partial [Klebsiella pneumoniae]|nr:class I SAM-dependent methyltransferase [Klebsiella pneumoniae]